MSGLVRDPDWTIWVMRPGDDEAWCWGGSYDDPDGTKTEQRILELERDNPSTWGWGRRSGRGTEA